MANQKGKSLLEPNRTARVKGYARKAF